MQDKERLAIVTGMNKIDVTKNIGYPLKKNVTAKVVVVLEGKVENRGLELIPTRSRALCKNQIHEIIVTDDANAQPGKTVDPIAYLGFAEITEGGVILTGDSVYLDNKYIGKVAGYDETHFPNHINIVIFSEARITGTEHDASLDSMLEFRGHGN